MLGSGPTAAFAYRLLRISGAEARLVGSFAAASIAPVDTPFGPVTLIPVFPPSPPPPYPPSIPDPSVLRLSRFGSSAWIDQIDSAPGALLSSLACNRDGAAMAHKQYGTQVRHDALGEVQRKIARAYSGGARERLGYTDGVSPYYATMLDTLNQADPPPAAATCWRPRRHELVIVGTAEPLRYDKIVYAGTLKQLEMTLETSTLGAQHTSASFGLYTTKYPIEMNHLVYDLREDSPIFRAFTPRQNVALVQYSQSVHVTPRKQAAATRHALAEIFSSNFDPFGPTIHLPNAYPTETLTAREEAEMAETCAQLDILRFGRAATARYLDLHELPWEQMRGWHRA